jgi:hypothetical protein
VANKAPYTINKVYGALLRYYNEDYRVIEILSPDATVRAERTNKLYERFSLRSIMGGTFNKMKFLLNNH